MRQRFLWRVRLWVAGCRRLLQAGIRMRRSRAFRSFRAAGPRNMRATPSHHDKRIMRRLDGWLFWCRVQGRSPRPDEPFARAVWTFADLVAERPVLDLTRRKREIAIRDCQGRMAKEIARDLDLSPRRVDQYRARLFRKTGTHNKAELVAVLTGLPV